MLDPADRHGYDPTPSECLTMQVDAFLARHSLDDLAEALAAGAPLAGLINALLALAGEPPLGEPAEPVDDVPEVVHLKPVRYRGAGGRWHDNPNDAARDYSWDQS